MIFENFQKSSEYFGNSSKQFLTSFYDFLKLFGSVRACIIGKIAIMMRNVWKRL